MKSKYNSLALATLACTLFTAATAQAAVLAFDNFSTYTTGNLNGQSGGALTGFTGTWSAATGAPAVTVNDTTELLLQPANKFRSRRNFVSGVASLTTGTVYVRTNMAVSNAAAGVNFSALELGTASDTTTIRLQGDSGGLSVSTQGTGGVGSSALTGNDALYHTWLVELNLDTNVGKAWIDGNLGAFNPAVGGAGFTAPTAFTLGGINIATFGTSSSTFVSDITIGQSWTDLGVTVIPEPSAAALGGLGILALLRRRRH